MTTKKLAQYLLIGLCIVLIILIYAMFKYFPPNGVLICKMESAPEDTYAKYTYKIEFKFWKATKFISEERIVSNDKNFLLTYEEEIKNNTSKYFQNETVLLDNELIIKTTVDYKKLEINHNSNQIEPNLEIGSMKKEYESIGAKCKYN